MSNKTYISATADISSTEINYKTGSTMKEQKQLMEIVLRTGEGWAGVLGKSSAALRHYRSGRNDIPPQVLSRVEKELIAALTLANKIRENR